MNWKLLTIPTSLFATSLLLMTACEPCEGDECNFDSDFGGAPGDGGTGGYATGGSGGTGGYATGGYATGGDATGGLTSGGGGLGGLGGASGGTAPLDCQEDGTPAGTPGSCEPGEPDSVNYECESCVQQFCCSEREACEATKPRTACRWGATLLEGEPIEGEFDCMLACLRNLPPEDFLGDEYNVEECAAQCGSAQCNEAEAGPAAKNLITCMLGINNEDYPLGCQEACQMGPE